MSEEKLPFAIVPIEAFFDSRLTLTQLRVLGALLSFRNRSTGIVFPGRDAIAARTGLPLTKISTTTTQLVALGWLTKTGCGGRSSPCAYEVTTPIAVSRAVLASIEAHGSRHIPETMTDPETVTESETPAAKTVPDSETVTAETVPDSGTKTVTDSVTKRSPNRERAKERPVTDQGTEKSARGGDALESGTRLTLRELPADWAAWTARERPDLDCGQTWNKFLDYWTAQAGPKGRKSDWFAAWRFWTRNEYADNPNRRTGNGTPGSAYERRQRVHEQIRVNAKRHFEEVD
jgi:hypothetical protein